MITIEDLANDAYSRGTHPLDYAEVLVEFFVESRTGLHRDDPASARLARLILGALLDAGWTMPGGTGGP